MGVGHAAVALGAGKSAPRVNVGWFVFAAFLADFLLGIFAAFGLEQAHVPPDFASRHYLTFTFPYSHGLVPLLVWGALLGLLVAWVQGGEHRRVFLIVATLVVSHFFLDGLVHVAGLPIVGDNSPKLGLGLWNHLPVALSLETAMAAVGAALYFGLAARGAGWQRWGILLVMVLLTAMTWTVLFATQPPTPTQLTAGWIIVPLLFSGVIYALDRKRAATCRANTPTADFTAR